MQRPVRMLISHAIAAHVSDLQYLARPFQSLIDCDSYRIERSCGVKAGGTSG